MDKETIYRQDAIDVLSLGKEILSRVLDDVDVVGIDREKYSWGLELIEAYINDIKELPAVQTCKDTVSRQRAIHALAKHLRMTDVPVSYPGIISALTEWLNELPPAQPEIIRCKDCIHRPIANDTYNFDDWNCGFDIEFPDYRCPCRCDDEYYNRIPDDDWFCGNAERGEQE